MNTDYEVIIIGGSFAGLLAGVMLQPTVQKMLVINDGGSYKTGSDKVHNFITQNGRKLRAIAAKPQNKPMHPSILAAAVQARILAATQVNKALVKNTYCI